MMLDTPKVVVTLLALAVSLALLFWRRAAFCAAAKRLRVAVTRRPYLPQQYTDMLQHAPLLSFMRIDGGFARQHYPDLSLRSLGEYMASLSAEGDVSLQGALVSVVDQLGLRVALPLALFAPPGWRKDRLEMFSGAGLEAAPLVGTVLCNGISTLGMLTISTLSQRSNLDLVSVRERRNGSVPRSGRPPSEEGKVDRPRRLTAIELMARGASPYGDGGIGDTIGRTSFHLVNDMVVAVKAAIQVHGDGASHPGAHDEDKSLDAPAPVPIHPFFPDLYLGSGSLKMRCGRSQAAVNTAMAIVCNRLMANSLVGVIARPNFPTEVFEVLVPSTREGDAPVRVRSVEALVQVLESTGHTVMVSLTSNLTSFGIGLCVKEENGSFSEVPLAYPLDTGLFARDEFGKETPAETLMAHAAISMEISGPLLPECSLEYCLSIQGMAGWLPQNGIERPWQRDAASICVHSEEAFATPQGRLQALRLMTASAAVANAASSKGKLLFGGYGFLGVCVDSVAWIQQAMSGTCTLYPLLLGGDAKMGLVAAYDRVQRAGAGGGAKAATSERWEYDAEARKLREALLALPCDGIVDPRVAGDTARRALATMPERSVFAAAARCRAGLQVAVEAAERLVVGNCGE